MKSTNIVVALDTRRKRNDGTYPLILRLGHRRRTIPIPLGIYLKEKDWDENTRLIKRTHADVSSVTRLNNLIQKKKSDAMDILLQLDEKGEANALSVKAIKDRLDKQDENQSFFSYTEQLVKEMVFANRIGTAKSYQCVARVVKTFNKGKDLRFSDITYPFLLKFEAQHKSKGNGANGLAVYMRTIRAIYNKAIKSGLADKASYPFEGYTIKTAPTEKRALESDLLSKIIALDLPVGHPLHNARNYFLASYMMYGMNFTDMAFLRKTDGCVLKCMILFDFV